MEENEEEEKNVFNIKLYMMVCNITKYNIKIYL